MQLTPQKFLLLYVYVLAISLNSVLSIPKKRPLADGAISASAPKRATGRGRSFMQMAPPPRHGEKEIPVGSETCFAGFRFVITGVLDSLERDEAARIIEVNQYFMVIVRFRNIELQTNRTMAEL
jgi:hypothetical protein